MLKLTLLVVVAAIALLLIYAATRPDTFRVERSIRIQAKPEQVFALINDLHGFNRWNPFEKKDPAIKGQYSDIAAGPGASYAWDSEKIGVGKMTIVETAPAAKVTMQLDFLKPFEAHNIAEFTLVPDANSTQVTWAMHGPAPFFSRLMHVVFNMDKMIGKDFAEGLTSLKTLAEKP